MSATVRPSRRYLLLDPLRGAASGFVLFAHTLKREEGYFAVLAFFVISGYCILASAEAGLERGMTMGAYMRRRVRRIYPPYLISTLFYIASRLVKYKLTGALDLAGRTPAQWIEIVTLTQWIDKMRVFFTGRSPAKSALLVGAHWSLNYEEQFYLFVGLVMLAAARLRCPTRSILIPFTIATVALLFAFPTLSMGLFVDYWPLFGAGALVYYRVMGEGGPRLVRAIDGGLAALFVVTTSIYVVTGKPIADQRYAIQDLAFTSGMALLFIALRPYDARLMKTLPLRLLGKLGTISYSLYLFHQFNLFLVARVADRVLGEGRWHPLHVALEIALQLALASGFWWLFERPFLNPPVEVAAPAPAPAPAAAPSP